MTNTLPLCTPELLCALQERDDTPVHGVTAVLQRGYPKPDTTELDQALLSSEPMDILTKRFLITAAEAQRRLAQLQAEHARMMEDRP